MTKQLILSTKGSKKMHKVKGTQPCTFRQLWDNVPYIPPPPPDTHLSRYIAECIGIRAALLAAAGVAGLLNKMNRR